MKQEYDAIVIGGGITGVAILYHLAKRGMTNVALIERRELTAGSTWHAAAGNNQLHDVTNIVALVLSDKLDGFAVDPYFW